MSKNSLHDLFVPNIDELVKNERLVKVIEKVVLEASEAAEKDFRTSTLLDFIKWRLTGNSLYFVDMKRFTQLEIVVVKIPGISPNRKSFKFQEVWNMHDRHSFIFPRLPEGASRARLDKMAPMIDLIKNLCTFTDVERFVLKLIMSK